MPNLIDKYYKCKHPEGMQYLIIPNNIVITLAHHLCYRLEGMFVRSTNLCKSVSLINAKVSTSVSVHLVMV